MKHFEDNLYYDIVGKHLQRFILRKWTTQKRAAKILGVAPARISEYISGERVPGSKIILTLTNLGFDQIYFDKWFGVSELHPETLTKKEMMETIANQNYMLTEQNKLINFLSKQLDKKQW